MTPNFSKAFSRIDEYLQARMAAARTPAMTLALFDLHAPITDYLPWFQVRSPDGPIAAHHLLISRQASP
jgi:hypothetical protein